MYGVGPVYVAVIITVTMAGILLSQFKIIAYLSFPIIRMVLLMIGFLLVAVGAALWFLAVFRAKIDDGITNNHLVTDGVYALVRNPIYSAFLSVCTGTLTAFGLIPWIALHLFYIMILYAFSWLSAGSYAEAALPLGEALFAHFSTGREKGMDINMKNTDTKQHLGDVQETALIPLAIRANETERKTARIHDDKAVEIIRELDVDTEKLDQFFSHEGVIAGTILFDETVKKLLRKYPDAVCINIGCGLDDRLTRVDNGKIQWYNVDLADSIEIRKKFFHETEREHMLAADILKPNWADGILKSDMAIVIAEGLLMYFSREQVKTLLNSLTGSFDRGFLLAELMHPKMMNEKRHDTVKNTNAKFGWGTVTGRALLPLDAKLTLINERSFWEEMKKYSLIGKIGSVIAGKLNNRLAVYRWQ